MRISLASALLVTCSALAVGATSSTSSTAAAPPPSDSRSAAVDHARISAAREVLGPNQGSLVRDVVRDADGSSHVRFDRSYRGLEVVGGDFVVHQGPTGAFRSVSGRPLETLRLSMTPTLSAQQAADLAASRVGYRPDRATPELVVLADGNPALTYRVNVEGRAPDGSPQGTYVFVDARSGRTLASWPSELTETGSGTGLYVGTVPLESTSTGSAYALVDGSRGGNATHNGPFASSAPVFTDADNVWGTGASSNAQTAAVDAHYGIAKTWDFYKTTFGRNGIGNDGKGTRAFVHDGMYVNASWSDSCFCMKYGDGDGGKVYNALVELDIAGHEMSHGVTSRTAKLQYRGESGGLNEATSDIMGTLVEFFAANADDPGDYVIGEEIFTSYNPATRFIRRMDKPSMDGASQDCWNAKTKSVDVHYSSGPANHFFFLLAEGSGAKTLGGVAYNSPTCNGSTVTGIGRSAAGAIWYRALTTYMTSTTTYAGARIATVTAASDLYGATSVQVAAVKAAWSAVNVK